MQSKLPSDYPHRLSPIEKIFCKKLKIFFFAFIYYLIKITKCWRNNCNDNEFKLFKIVDVNKYKNKF